MRTKDFYEILFDPDESTCFSDTPYGVRVEPVNAWLRRSLLEWNFVCINPLHPERDLAPTRPQHSEFIGRRADINVTAYRNFLCEFDKGEINEQRKVIETIPYATLVFSGGKSLHAIISLEEPCTNKQEYDRLVRRIYAKLPGVDRSGKNPSRFTRAPGVLRGDVRQELLDVRPRTSKLAIEAWLGPDNLISEVSATPMFPGQRILRDETNHFLSVGSPEGGWNNALFKAAADMTRSGYSREEIVHLCGIPTGYLDEKDLRTIDSAIRSSHGSSLQSSD